MQLYNVMLVDDEEEVRKAIERKLNWEELGFKLIGAVENGEEALLMAENVRPDVVLTDIHMPFMDGLTLGRKLKEMYKDTRLVIFSGYDEFEYAKEAIKIEVEEYILKPIDSVELENLFKRIKNSLDEEIARKRNTEQLEKYYIESLPILKEQLMAGFLEGTVEEQQLYELREAYGDDVAEPFYGENYCVAVFKTEAGSSGEAPMNAGFVNISLKQIVEENLKGHFDSRVCIYVNTVIVIATLGKDSNINGFVNLVSQICQISSRILGIKLYSGVGNVAANAFEISNSFEGAKHAIDYRIIFEPNSAIFIQDIEPKNLNQFSLGTSEIQTIIKAIKVGTQEELESTIIELVGKLKDSKISLKQLEYSYVEIFVEILRFARSYNIDMEQIVGKDFLPHLMIDEFDSLESLCKWLIDVCSKISEVIRKQRSDSTKSLVHKAVQYINENYSQSDLSVDALCKVLNVSATYFSTIFKKSIGMGFVSYLTKVRLEKAIELLDTTDEKSYVIAGMIGYQEPNYFSYVFKKEYGMSPSKYRSSKNEK